MDNEIANKIYKLIQIDSVSMDYELVGILIKYHSFPLNELIETRAFLNLQIPYKVAANSIINSSLFHDSIITTPTICIVPRYQVNNVLKINTEPLSTNVDELRVFIESLTGNSDFTILSISDTYFKIRLPTLDFALWRALSYVPLKGIILKSSVEIHQKPQTPVVTHKKNTFSPQVTPPNTLKRLNFQVPHD